MAFPTVQGRSDPRVLCGILAEEVLPQLQGHHGAPGKQALIPLVNLVRLLDMYRYGVMHEIPRPRGIADRSPSRSALALMRPRKDPYQDLQAILQAAQEEVFPGQDKEAVVVLLRDVLILTIDGEPAPQGDLQKTHEFFTVCLRLLNAS